MSALTVRPLHTHEIEALGALFPEGERLLKKPGFKLKMCRVGLRNGQIEAQVLIEPHTLRYGSVSLYSAGISHLHVGPTRNRRDTLQTMMHDALAFMAEQGAHLALLHEPPIASSTDEESLGDAFGFYPVWPYYLLEYDAEEAAAQSGKIRLRDVRIRDARHDDIPQIAALHERHWSGRVAFTRSPENWVWRMSLPVTNPDRWHVIVVESGRGKITGYLAERAPGSPEVEMAVDTQDAAVLLLVEGGRRAGRLGQRWVRWFIPPDDALIVCARQLLEITVSVRYPRKGGWRARLIDAPGLAEALLPEIAAQARHTLPDFDPATLVFDCQPDRIRIGLKGQEATFAALNYRDFIQLMFGSVSPNLLAISAGLPAESVGLLSALFPPRMACLSCWDWF